MATTQQMMDVFDQVVREYQSERYDPMHEWLRYMTIASGPYASVSWDDIATPFVPDYLKLPEGM